MDPETLAWLESQTGCMQRTGCRRYAHGTDCPLYDWPRALDAGRPL